MSTETPMIYAAMCAVMRDMVAIGKDSINQQQGFKFRGIDSVYNALNPLLAKNGIFTTPKVLDKSREERTNSKGTVLSFTCLRMEYVFWAADGSSVSCVVEGEGMDSGDKSSNKAMAVAHKYALLQTFCIPTEEAKDPDEDTHEVRPDPRRADGVAAPGADSNAGIIEQISDARAQFIAKLEDAFKAGGIDQLRSAWLSLTNHQRAMVGMGEIERIKASGQAAA